MAPFDGEVDLPSLQHKKRRKSEGNSPFDEGNGTKEEVPFAENNKSLGIGACLENNGFDLDIAENSCDKDHSQCDTLQRNKKKRKSKANSQLDNTHTGNDSKVVVSLIENNKSLGIEACFEDNGSKLDIIEHSCNTDHSRVNKKKKEKKKHVKGSNFNCQKEGSRMKNEVTETCIAEDLLETQKFSPRSTTGNVVEKYDEKLKNPLSLVEKGNMECDQAEKSLSGDQTTTNNTTLQGKNRRKGRQNLKEEVPLTENNTTLGTGACLDTLLNNGSLSDFMENLSDKESSQVNRKKSREREKRTKDFETNCQMEDSSINNGLTEKDLLLASEGETVDVMEMCKEKGKAVLSLIEKGNAEPDQMGKSLAVNQSTADNTMKQRQKKTKSNRDSSVDTIYVINNPKLDPMKEENTTLWSDKCSETHFGSGESFESLKNTAVPLEVTAQSSSKTANEVEVFEVLDDESHKDPATSASVAEIVLGSNVDIMDEKKRVDRDAGVLNDTAMEEKEVSLPQHPILPFLGCANKKLLILDLNGILADVVMDPACGYKPDWRLGHKFVFKRPFCDDFLLFCFGKFNIGVWSSRTKKNVDKLVDFLMGDSRKKLLFCWDQSHCTHTGFTTVENREKPLVLKELKKLWENFHSGLPWRKGEYNETNTLLLDDSPYKALRNPRHTAIFPASFRYKHRRDSSLGPGGDLRIYLEQLAVANNVQEFVSRNPFGQRPITESNPSWGFYKKIIYSDTLESEKVTSS